MKRNVSLVALGLAGGGDRRRLLLRAHRRRASPATTSPGRGRRRRLPDPLLPRPDGLGLVRRLRRGRGLEPALPRRPRATRATTTRRTAAVELGLALRRARHRHRRDLGALHVGRLLELGPAADLDRDRAALLRRLPRAARRGRGRAETRRRLAAAYAVLGLVGGAVPLLRAAAPRLHAPSRRGDQRPGQGRGRVAACCRCCSPSSLGFTVLFFWMHSLRSRASWTCAARGRDGGVPNDGRTRPGSRP